MAVDDEEGMHHAGNPEAQRQDQIEHGLKWFAAQKDGDWWADDGEKVSHGVENITCRGSKAVLPSRFFSTGNHFRLG
jgi:hypothetical protein